MELQEKCKIIEDLINQGLHFDNASAMISRADPWSGICLTLKKHKFHDWEDLLMGNFFEQIYAMTGMIWTALDRHKDGVTIYLHNADDLSSCDVDGTPWEDTHYRAKCPVCGETKSFDLMRYNPKDTRDSTCPKCNDTHRVHTLFNLTKKK